MLGCVQVVYQGQVQGLTLVDEGGGSIPFFTVDI